MNLIKHNSKASDLNNFFEQIVVIFNNLFDNKLSLAVSEQTIEALINVLQSKINKNHYKQKEKDFLNNFLNAIQNAFKNSVDFKQFMHTYKITLRYYRESFNKNFSSKSQKNKKAPNNSDNTAR